MKSKHRAASHAKRRRWEADPSAFMRVMTLHQDPEEPMVVDTMEFLRECFDHARNGGTSVRRFDKLAGAINVGMVRAEAIEFGSSAVDTMQRAIDAMENAAERFKKVGHFGFAALEIVDIDLALDLYAQILALSTPIMMVDAGKEADRRVAKLRAERAAAAKVAA